MPMVKMTWTQWRAYKRRPAKFSRMPMRGFWPSISIGGFTVKSVMQKHTYRPGCENCDWIASYVVDRYGDTINVCAMCRWTNDKIIRDIY